MTDTSIIKSILDDLTGKFFNLFTNKDDRLPDIDAIYGLCIPEAIIIKNTGAAPEIFTLQQFIEPRKKILTDGTLIHFSEEEVTEKTEIFGNIAHRFCLYKKSGILSGQPFEMKGMKTIQFILTPSGWKICSLAWDDEREGLTVSNNDFIG